jgi:hypothetical protein
MTNNLKTGTPDVKPGLPSHVNGIKQGNSTGNYEKQAGHHKDGTSTAERSTGVNSGFHEPIDPRMPNISPA